MKLNLSKKNIKMLSADNKKLPTQATPAVAGGYNSTVCTRDCITDDPQCRTYNPTRLTGCCRTTIC